MRKIGPSQKKRLWKRPFAFLIDLLPEIGFLLADVLMDGRNVLARKNDCFSLTLLVNVINNKFDKWVYGHYI